MLYEVSAEHSQRPKWTDLPPEFKEAARRYLGEEGARNFAETRQPGVRWRVSRQ